MHSPPSSPSSFSSGSQRSSSPLKEAPSTPRTPHQDLQNRIREIAAEAKARNPEGYVDTPDKTMNRAYEASIYDPFVTETGQHIVFFNDAVNVPAKLRIA